MFCRNCGFNNADGVRFCAKCGNTLEAAPAAPAAPTAPNYGAPTYGAAPAGTPAYSAVTKAASAVSSAKVKKVLPFAAAGVAAATVAARQGCKVTLIERYGFGVAIQTKSARILRDLGQHLCL